MTDTAPPPLPRARPRRRRFDAIWLVPILAVLAAAYLGWDALSRRGPVVEVEFRNAEGLIAGQTPVRYRSVQVGTVEGVRLSDDLTAVRVSLRMESRIADRLTESARFWVVRPRLDAGNLSGLGTLVSGPYVEFDPGQPGDPPRQEFGGLEDPPGVRSDEPGRIFTLRTWGVGALGQGSPVFFRDVEVGQVLGIDPPKPDGPVTLRAFVRAPYDGYLREGSIFWNASGARADFGPGGIRFAVGSVKALLSGGVAFETPRHLRDGPPAPDGASFYLFQSQEEAESATSPERLLFLAYAEGSVRGLEPGAPVELRGIRVGSVVSVGLEYDAASRAFRVPVRLAVEPSRISYPAGRPQGEVLDMARRMVEEGLRVQFRGGNLLTGQLIVALDPVPGAPPAEVRMEGEDIVLPTAGGGSSDLVAAATAIAGQLERFPLEEIGRNLNGLLAGASGIANGPELKAALGNLAGTLGEAQSLLRKADKGLGPLLERLPAIAKGLDQAVSRAAEAAASIDRGYGDDSRLNRQLERLLEQANDAARSVRQLADQLDRHPESLLRGRGSR